MTPSGSPGRRVSLGLWVEDEIAVADGFVADGECEHSVKDEASGQTRSTFRKSHYKGFRPKRTWFYICITVYRYKKVGIGSISNIGSFY